MRKLSYLSLLLILSMLLSLCIVPASAAEAWDTNPMTEEQVAALDIPYFEQTDGTIALGISDSETTGSYKGTATSLNLPSSIDGKRVTKVAKCAFFAARTLTSVTLPNSLLEIGDSAFARTNISSVTIPASCTVLNNGCFKDCRALETVTIQGAAKATGYYLPFTFCANLKTIYLETCLADKEWQDSTGAELAEVIWSHKIISEWSPWAKTHLAKDENGNSLWNGHYRHYRTATCADCGTAYEFEACDFVFPDSWSPNGVSNHIKRGVCSICSDTNVEFETHSSFGDWVSISKSQHSRQVDCDVCGYSGSETAQHSFQYGTWSDYSDIQHQRQVTCSECDYVGTQLAAHSDQGNDGYCDTCWHQMSRFSVTVPATLNLTVAQDGTVYAATSAQIVNNSTGAVCVTSVKLTAENGWLLVPYSTNMADVKVDSKQIGFSLNGAEGDGSATLPMSGSWVIAKDAALSLDYDAVVSATSNPINEQVLTVVFVLDWAA